MNPLIALAGAVFPEILKLLVSDGTNTLASRVIRAVTDVAGTDSATEAREKVEQDPEVATELQTRLAEIALDSHKADLDRQAEADSRDLAFNQMQAANTQNARDSLRHLIELSDPIAYTPPAVSYLVAIGFLIILFLMMSGTSILPEAMPPSVVQIVNTLVGALAAAFATVINFWLGSSLGSRKKDADADRANTVNQMVALVPAGPPPAPRVASRQPQAGAPSGMTGVAPGAVVSGTVPPGDVATVPEGAHAGIRFGSFVQDGFYSADPSDVRVPRSIRTNNPGALNAADWQTTRPGYVGVTPPDTSSARNVTTTFRTPEHGVAAWYHLLKNVYGLDHVTLADLARHYAGPHASDEDVEAYVAGWLRWARGSVGRDESLGISDIPKVIELAKAMFAHEAGRPTPLLEEQIKYGIDSFDNMPA